MNAPGAPALLAEGCAESQKLHLIYALSQESGLTSHARMRLILTHDELRARKIRDEYQFYDRNTVLFPAKDLIFYQADLKSREIQIERLRCLRRLIEGRPLTVVTTFSALMTPQIPLRVLKDNILRIEKGGELTTEFFSRSLVAMGYEKCIQTETPGQFSIRGDILDVFDLTEENPYRIELWGDEVESIRSFDALTQRSMQMLESVRIYPATEMILPAERVRDGLVRISEEADRCVKKLREEGRPEAAHRLQTGIEEQIEEARDYGDYSGLESYIHYFYPMTESFLSLFPQDYTTLYYDEPGKIRSHAEAVELEFRESMIGRAEAGLALPGQMELLQSAEKTQAQCERFPRLGLTLSLTGADLFRGREEEGQDAIGNNTYFENAPIINLHARSVTAYNRSFEALQKDLAEYRKKKYSVILISPSRTRAKRLAQDLTDNGLTAFYSENPERTLEPGEIMTYYGNISHGFEYPDLHFAVIADSDIFGARKTPKKKVRKYEGESISEFSELKPGDYVVHEDYGIGIYRGVEQITVENASKDYLKIEYAAGGTLYILPSELSALQKYAAADTEAKPKINKLGTQEWNGTKAKVRGAVAEVAEDLVKLYAARQALSGHAFAKDTVWQREFEELFPFEETEDQLQAIEDTKRDMESSRIMDRLICGDVGYGKTEIAVRAAFKAVQDGKQVAVLVPTTILAQQHFNTFTERMHSYPVNIELLSRFRSAAEQKKTLRALEEGKADIVIGTHRILSKDVHFKDLGLLVVDEEQRFGVSHKEKIKKLKENVDVLTLTATPIPRTLHMSLVGIRDMSVLEEAPGERVPIQTYVMEYNDEMVREAITRELSRGGQIYYVYNRVSDIDRVAAGIAELVPEARVAYAHGQMDEAQLEKIMYDFISARIDVLVSTTIIETGLDISNVNTMIIHDSDRLGLSQLYQLRGRVGRSNRVAYAFLMYRRNRMLKETAEKRLSAIREFTDLGSGFRIAMRDLEIRGAGSILGRAQHGHMQAVGYDLYCKLLNEAVKTAKGEPTRQEESCKVNLHVNAFLPDSYVVNERQKLDIYKKIAEIRELDDVEEMKKELSDRFGEVPASAQNLLRISLIRAIAMRLEITEITGGNGVIRFGMKPNARVRVEMIPELLRVCRGRLQFFPKGLPYFEYSYPVSGVSVRDEETLLSQTEDFLVKVDKYLR